MNWAWIADVAQIIFADIILSGDNALVIGMAAAGLSPKLRKRAIFFGMAMAAGLRILFAIVASHLLAIQGILIIGGVLLALHKMMLHIMAMRMVEFHSRVSHQLAEDGEATQALAWGRDGGKFQAVLNIMSTVGCSDDDPTCTVK